MGKQRKVLTEFNRKICKELLKNRVEWEGGVYSPKLSDLRSFLLDQAQRNQAQELLDSIFLLCVSGKRYYELSSFLGILETVLGEGRNHLATSESLKVGNGSEKSTANREYLGKLLVQTLASDSSLTMISDNLEILQKSGSKTASGESDAENLRKFFIRIFTLTVRCLPGKKMKKLEQLMRRWNVYKNMQGPQINQLSQYTGFLALLVDFFVQNNKIQSFEEISLTLEQADHVFKNLDF